MIKKIDIPKSTVIDPSVLWGGINDSVLAAKINEVIDVVNSLRDDCNLLMGYIAPENKCEPAENATISKMEKVDPYAEQRKWIGKLCWFWDIYPEGRQLDILVDINAGDSCTPYETDTSYFHSCEPVKPDDDIIYKGE